MQAKAEPRGSYPQPAPFHAPRPGAASTSGNVTGPHPDTHAESARSSGVAPPGPVAGAQYEEDSAIGDNVSMSGSTTVSVRVYDFRVEHGRQYHALHSDAEYHLPNDDRELDRLDLQHELFRMTLDGNLFNAPLQGDVHHVLDVGAGTGTWALEFAETNPSATVVGTDISPVRSSAQRALPNCKFYIEDVEQDWNFDVDFDFIHARMMAFGLKDWPTFFRQAYAHLKPGGWLELQDLASPVPRCDDGTVSPESPLMAWAESMRTASRRAGIDVCAADNFTAQLRSAGFADIRVRTEVWPLGSWPRDEKLRTRAAFASRNLADGLEGFSMSLFTKMLGWSEEQVRTLVDRAIEQIDNGSDHIYLPVVFVWCRRPLGS